MVHRIIRRRSVHTVLMLMATLTLSACSGITVDGLLTLTPEQQEPYPENYFDSNLGTVPVQAMIGLGSEFSFDAQAALGPTYPELKIVADLAVNDELDTMAVLISLTVTDNAGVGGQVFTVPSEITLDNFSWEADGIIIAGVTEDSDDFPVNRSDGIEFATSPTELMFTLPYVAGDIPFQYEAHYTVALQGSG